MTRRILRKVLPASAFQRPRRLDHGRMYMCVIIGLWATSISMILLGPLPNSTISNLNGFTQTSMAYVLFVGTSMCINGIFRGTRVFRPKADIRDSYKIAKWAILAIGASLGTYVIAIFLNYGNFWLSTISGSIGFAILVGCLWNAWDFSNEVETLNLKLKKEVEDDELG